MRLSVYASVAAASGSLVSAAAVPPAATAYPALPLSAFNHQLVKPWTPEEVLNGSNHASPPAAKPATEFNILAAAATCTTPRVRTEWDNLSTADRTGFINAIKCLQGKPQSGQFANAKSRYEDLVSLHQGLTPNVHGNAKFLVWHRYYMWVFEDILRSECGFTGTLPWWDETKYSGRFAQSSIFTADWFGTATTGGQCVTNGAFANLGLNVGPGAGNTPHCLARGLNEAITANTNSGQVVGCTSRTDYADMAGCLEGGPHAAGHNGVGAVMGDAYASPGDPVFWLHHGFIDRNYRIWQNADPARITYIDGNDHFGTPLTLDTGVSVAGLRPDVKIRDIINTVGTQLCYKYNY